MVKKGEGAGEREVGGEGKADAEGAGEKEMGGVEEREVEGAGVKEVEGGRGREGRGALPGAEARRSPRCVIAPRF